MNIIMSRAVHHQYHRRLASPSSSAPTSPLDFTDRIPFSEIKLSNETLGSGSYGTVFKGRWRGRHVAVKQFRTREEINSFLVEVKQLSCVNHPNIVTLYGASSLTDTAYLIMEYAEGGSLNHLLHECKQQQYDLRHACSWAMQTARGVAYLHGIRPKPIMHRDLKPANLLLFRRGSTLKICDFGTACTVKTQMTNNTGSASYMAPEVFATSSYLESGDVYSWSIIFWEILARRNPYSPQYSNPYQILWCVKELGIRPSELIECPKIIWNLITRGWNKNPKSRPTMREVADEMAFIFSLADRRSKTNLGSNPSTPTTTTTTDTVHPIKQQKNHSWIGTHVLDFLPRFQNCRTSREMDNNHQYNQASPSDQPSQLCGNQTASSQSRRGLYIMNRASMHYIEMLKTRARELEESGQQQTAYELVEEIKALKRKTKMKKEELQSRLPQSPGSLEGEACGFEERAIVDT